MKVRTCLLPLLLCAWIVPAFATAGSSIADLEFKLSINAGSDFSIKTYSLPITGSLGGDGAHDERWGLWERGADPVHGVPTNEGSLVDSPTNYWGPLWGTQTLKDANSVTLLMLTEAFASYPPSSDAWARSSAQAGLMAEVTNTSSEAKAFDVSISRMFYADVVALADPGQYAFAEASWDFSFSQQLGSTTTTLFKFNDHIETEASLDAGRYGYYHISSITDSYTKELNLRVWLDAGETTRFNLDKASLYSHALTAPDGCNVACLLGLSLALLLVGARSQRGARVSP